MSDKYLIWWLSEEDCKQMPPLYEDEDKEKGPLISEYIIHEFDSRLGRAGRGRLWVSDRFDIEEIEWDNNKPMAKAASRCGGIVIDIRDVNEIAYFPGFVTDLSLTTYQPLDLLDPIAPERTCELCRHWRKIRDEDLVSEDGSKQLWPGPHGECALFDEYSTDQLAWLSSMTGEDLSLITKPDFACNEWKALDLSDESED